MNISVIIPVKNRADLLSITLENVLEQTLPPYEIIVVDDHSTDAINKVKMKYAERVIFLNSKGNGPGAARNTGLHVATGNAIQFFDSDDLMTKNKLQVQAELLASTTADFVYGPWVKAIHQDGDWQQTDVIMQYYPLPANRKLSDLVLEGWCPITQSVLFLRDIIAEAGHWREDLMPHEDYEYWFRIGKIANKFSHQNESCVVYRQHQKQITDQDVSNQSRWLDGLHAMQLIKEEIDYKPAVHSLQLFKGSYASSKINFEKKYGYTNNLSITLTEQFQSLYYKFFTKINHLQTGANWQKMQGILPMENIIFRRYINML